MLLRIIYTLCAVLLCACSGSDNVVKGSGKIVKTDRTMNEFTNIELIGTGTLVLKQGDKPALTIETDDNLIEYIRTDVSGGTLYIEVLKNATLSPSKGLLYFVTVKDLNSVKVSGAAVLRTLGEIESNALTVSLSGAGTLNMTVDAKELNVQISGTGDAIFKGEAKQEKIDVSGAGSFKGFDLVSKNASVSMSGVGNAEINASEALNVEISGVGSVLYKGTPSLKQNITGVGAVRHAE
ncbi:MAG: head GIN domain-containing protein [Parachlamydiales bacterium]|jgi:hypothetical protein